MPEASDDVETPIRRRDAAARTPTRTATGPKTARRTTATCSGRARSPRTTSKACSTSSTTTATSTSWCPPAARWWRSSAGGLQPLVGQRGATLEALQELTRLAVFRQTGSPSRLLLDVGGYRANRRKELAAVAKNAVEKVKEYGEPVRLEPMSRVRAQVRARRGQRARRGGERVGGRRAEPADRRPPGLLTVTDAGRRPARAVRPPGPFVSDPLPPRRSSATGSRWRRRTRTCWRPTASSAA